KPPLEMCDRFWIDLAGRIGRHPIQLYWRRIEVDQCGNALECAIEKDIDRCIAKERIVVLPAQCPICFPRSSCDARKICRYKAQNVLAQLFNRATWLVINQLVPRGV